jgi:hypothetical protein
MAVRSLVDLMEGHSPDEVVSDRRQRSKASRPNQRPIRVSFNGFGLMSQISPLIPPFSANSDSGFLFFLREGSGPPWNVGSTRGSGVSTVFHGTWTRPSKCAELLARLRTTGKAMPLQDRLIAATAMVHGLAVHGLAVATQNRPDFVNAGMRIVDPFVG